MFFSKKNETFNLELKAGGETQNKAFGELKAKIKANITKYCRQYHVADDDSVLQETMIEMFVRIGNGKYPPNGDMSWSPVASATQIGYYKTLEAVFRKKPPIAPDSDDKLNRMANELDADKEAEELWVYWEKVDGLVKHLNLNVKGICHELIWKRIAEQRSYDEIHPDYPQYKEQGGLRNRVSNCLKQWRELLEQDGLI